MTHRLMATDLGDPVTIPTTLLGVRFSWCILSRVAWLCNKCHTLGSVLSLGTPYPCNLIVILN